MAETAKCGNLLYELPAAGLGESYAFADLKEI